MLRGFRSIYLGLLINCTIMGWVNLAMAKILSVTMGWTRLTAVLVSLAITGGYSALFTWRWPSTPSSWAG